MTLDPSAIDELKRKKHRFLIFGHRASYFVFAGLLALFLAVAGIVGFRMLRAASLMFGMTYATPPLIVRAYSKVFRHVPVTSNLWIQSRRGPLEIRMMAPKDLPSAPIMVLVHGFAPEGVRDDLLNALAERLCRSGLRVVMPEIKSEEMLRIDRSAVSDVDDAIRWSAINSGQKVSLLGISFSGGMVITAAAEPNYADYVKLIFCISGYNSIDRLGRYYLRDDVRGPDGKPYTITPPADPLAPMALQYMDELVPPGDVGPLSGPVRAVFSQPNSNNALATASLTERQRVLLDDLLNARTPAMRALYHAVLERHRAELAYISPLGKIDEIHGSLYVLHGSMDQRIPRGEAEWTKAEAKQKDNVRMVISPWINHSILIPHVPFREKLRVMYFVSGMLQEALRPVPLGAPKR